MNELEPTGGKITMLEGGKVLFDEPVGLQPVTLVEIPIEPAGHAQNGRVSRRPGS